MGLLDPTEEGYGTLTAACGSVISLGTIGRDGSAVRADPASPLEVFVCEWLWGPSIIAIVRQFASREVCYGRCDDS